VIFEATAAGRTARVEVREADGGYLVSIDGRVLRVSARPASGHFWTLVVDGRTRDAAILPGADGYAVALREGTYEVALAEAAAAATAAHRKAASGPAKVTAPMPGKIVRVSASAGQEVKAGECLLVMEAMKMENEIRATRDGSVRDVAVREGQAVESGALLMLVE
jgi:pyruvate dehydrogenase E2 component (dihydrolipoamide acetyltransferase)